MRYLKIGALALTALLLGTALFLIAADRLGQPAPPDPAALIAKARQYDVHIKRDTFGVPHVIGPRDVDVAFGFGFAHAEDDFATIQQVALAVRGQLAATEGPKAAVTDYLVHLFRVWEVVNARYERDLPPDVQHVMEAYADGVNYFAALHPGQTMRGALPLTGRDVAAGFVFKLPFFYGLDKELRKLTAPEQQQYFHDRQTLISDHARCSARGIQRRSGCSAALGRWCHEITRQFPPALQRGSRLVRGGARKWRRVARGRRLFPWLPFHAPRP
jgi:penicillin amidase/acyl-homoserine-lactone acylase